MVYELLNPVPSSFLQFVEELPTQSLGKRTTFFKGGAFVNYADFSIAIIGVGENRGFNKQSEATSMESVRKAFYRLCPGNWSTTLIDFGDISPGNKLEDTYFLLESLIKDLVKNGVLPVVIGGAQDLTYPLYKGLEALNKSINIVNIDSKLDIKEDFTCLSEGVISRIIMQEPVKLLNFCNLGYQTYFNSQEEIDLMHSLYFEGYRLGELINNIQISEPVLREADIVSLDLTSIKSSDSGNFDRFTPNGFDAREICSLARYSGLSDRVSVFGIFNYNNNENEALLIAQIIWYFIEGFNYRTNEYPFQRRESYTKYIVPVEGIDEFIFYKSNISARWWVESKMFGDAQKGIDFVISCSYEDYQQTLQQDIPERWWRLVKRSLL
ncbi:formimidoylglutamase [Myroides sp. LJL119]